LKPTTRAWRQLEKINGFHGDATKAEREYYDRLDEIATQTTQRSLSGRRPYCAWQEFSTKQSQIAATSERRGEVDETTRVAWLE
jgi:hypothetical protein